MSAKETSRAWWRNAVIYEIAAISFQDSNGDGYGDLPGLLQRIEYLKWLGVGAVWLTPIYKSPDQDFGYDISDFCAIDPRYGAMADFDGVRDSLHEAGIKLILDFVPNHTSDQHDWFQESRASRHNPKADWYVWAEAGSNGGPPNNWLSRFGGSAWEWCEARRQFYYHSFLTSQPDLNWRNEKVRQAMADTMRFWLDRGVDGFRIDASAVLIKDELLRDNPADSEADDATPPPQKYMPVFTDDRPEAMDCIEFIRGVLDEYGDRLLCGEVQGKTDRIGHFYGNDKPRLHLPLNFALLDTEWNAIALQATIDAYFNAIPDGGWPDFVIGGHDKRRVASKLGQAQSRIMAMLLMTLRGTPFLFAGDEIGSEQVKVPPTRIRDPFEKLVKGFGLNRDPERAPLRWDDSERGGFTTGEPWLPLSEERSRNIEAQRRDTRSLLHLYRELIALRRREPCLVCGEYRPRRAHNDIFWFARALDRTEILVGLNLCREPRLWEWQGSGVSLMSSYLDREQDKIEGPMHLRPNEGVVIKLNR
ncbi:alpha-amylase [Bradyrhizobium sp. WSM 1738]|uniref:alpha-amylase family glycosyl hydrolase n=1 Tax=Bradyrhizobium hereditatis TaxID=2821405 RepID=UPI001CE39262|nr:alpha-amylase family glycosyl hydrolase [Bradyrhizobium hereditatis]MCA6117436.1 alpha-amylase [Bradyrhizobium hereditatis]